MIKIKKRRKKVIVRTRAAIAKMVTITTMGEEDFSNLSSKTFRGLLKEEERQLACQLDLMIHIYS
jgi:hypothetical protein